MQRSIPYTVIGGYLGAGKTTLLNHLLRHSGGRRLAVMVNDFGAINIDADLIARHDGETITLASGCICCNLADGFLLALGRLSQRAAEIDHIVVEASGVADPVKLGQYGAILKLDLEGVIVLVDAEQIRRQAANKYVGDTVIRQLRGADLLVVNKVDLVTPAALAELRAWLAALAPAAQLVETTNGVVPLPVLLGTRHAEPGAAHTHGHAPAEHSHGEHAPAEHAPAEHDHAEHDHAEHDAHDEHAALYATATLTLPGPLDRARLAATLDALPDGVLRAKGFVRLADDPARLHLLQLVGRRWQLTPVAADTPAPYSAFGRVEPPSRLVFIGLPGSLDAQALTAALVGQAEPASTA